MLRTLREWLAAALCSVGGNPPAQAAGRPDWVAEQLLGALLMSGSTASDCAALTSWGLAVLAIKELFIGVVLGTLIRFAFSVLEIIGEMAHISSLTVVSRRPRQPLSTAYLLLGVGAFCLLGGHHGALSGLAATVHCAPPFEIPAEISLVGAGQDTALRLFSVAMATAVLLSAPIFVAGLFADVIIGVLSRLQSGAALAGAQTLRGIAVQLGVVLSLGLVVTHVVEFLQQGVMDLALCGM